MSQPPHPDPHPSRLQVPVDACDCHAHLFGDPEVYPYLPDRRYTPAGGSPAEYRRVLRVLGLMRAVIVQPAIYPDHRMTADALAQAGGAWRGIARIDSSISNRALQTLHRAGFRGARFNFHAGTESVATVQETARRIAPLGWHVQIHTAGRYLPQLAESLSTLPVDVVVDHFGRIPLDEGIAGAAFISLLRLLDAGRAWVKLSAPYALTDSGPPYPNLTPFAQALAAAAPERLLWGSDWPHPSNTGAMPNPGELLDLLAAWVPDEGGRRRILVDNPAALYGFSSDQS